VKILWSLSATLFLFVLINLSEIIAVSSMMIFIGGSEFLFTIIRLIFGKIVLMVLELLAIKLLTSFGKGSLPNQLWLIIVISPVFSIFILSAISQTDIMNTEYMPIVFLPISLGLMFINYFIYMISDQIIYKQNIDEQTRLLEQQTAFYQNQYQLAEQSQKETIKFRHDIKNILLGLKTELDAGKLTEGKDMLETLIEDFSSIKKVAHSGNMIIDSIINYKKRQADQERIPFYMDFQFPHNVRLDTTIISVILGNALDNAIEACRHVEEKDRYVKIQFHYENESLYIQIKNPYHGTIRRNRKGQIISNKKDSSMHGIGLQSIREMVKKMNGFFEISYNNGIFQLQIVLFDLKRNEKEMKRKLSKC
jgi:signal transduction histidine kinase